MNQEAERFRRARKELQKAVDALEDAKGEFETARNDFHAAAETWAVAVANEHELGRGGMVRSPMETR
jgi:hypothetical protein